MQENADHASAPHAVSIVLIGRNEGERLRLCLDSVLQSNYPIALQDVIYVDSCSSDGSCSLAREYGIRVLSLAGATTAARARNLGWTNVETELVMFLDGDTVLHPDFLRKAETFFTDPKVAAVFGIRKESKTDDSVYNAIFDMDWPRREGPVDYFGGDAMVRTSVLRKVDGYDPALIAGEEPDLCRRIRSLGYVVLCVALPMTMHDLAMSRFVQYWRRSLRTGHAYAEVSARYRSTPDPLWSAEAKRTLVRGSFWLLVPWVTLLLAVVLHSLWVIPVVCLLAVVTMFRSARHAHSAGSTLKVSLTYGLHSQLQHVPIFFGQCRYFLSRRSGSRMTLIEYK